MITKHLPHAVIVLLVCIFAYFINQSSLMTTKEREMYHEENSKLLSEKQTLLNQVRELQRETLIEETKAADGSSKIITKITEKAKVQTTQIEKSKVLSEVAKIDLEKTKEVTKNRGVRIGVGVQNLHEYVLKPQYSAVISAPILGNLGAFGTLSTDKNYSMGVYYEF